MRYFFVRFKGQLLRLLVAVSVFGVALLVLLYFLGYYDLSFLDRYKVLGELLNEPQISQSQGGVSALFDPSALLGDELSSGMTLSDPLAGDEGESGKVGVPDDADTSGGDDRVSVASYESTSVKRVFDAARLPDKLLSDRRSGSMTVSELAAEGYRTCGVSYSEAGLSFVSSGETSGEEDAPTVSSGYYTAGETVLGRLTFSFQLPDSLSKRRRQEVREEVVVPSDDGEWYVETQTVRSIRPAVELYMGYIMLDDGKDLSLIASDATPLCKIDERVYLPAYERDRYDRPLFYRKTESGERVYLYLAPSGLNFVSSSYDEVADGRGLSFDYPSYYGKSDSAVTTDRNGVTGRMAYVLRGVGMLTGYDFTRAYSFTGGYAAVTTQKNRGGLYYIDESGKRAFETWRYYFNEHGRDVYENLMPPLTDGIESIGFYYFDHGLTRVRRQVIDAYNWAYVGRVRTTRDEQVLLRTDGSEYELPAGYTLEGYSDGCILLSKDGLYGFTDYTGEWIAQPIYKSATPFIGGLATLTTEDGRTGMIDTEGNIVLQFTFDYISQVSDGLIAAYRVENGWTVFKLMEKGSASGTGQA